MISCAAACIHLGGIDADFGGQIVEFIVAFRAWREQDRRSRRGRRAECRRQITLGDAVDAGNDDVDTTDQMACQPIVSASPNRMEIMPTIIAVVREEVRVAW